MSTPIRVRLALCATLIATACSRPGAPDASVSYAGLDLPLSFEDPPPVSIGVVAGATGPDAAAGRVFADAVRGAFLDHGPSGREPPLRVHVLDDRGTAEGVRASAGRLETDPGVHVAIVAPGLDRAALAADIAARTVVVCVGCEASAATREGVFALVGDPADARAAVRWIRETMVGNLTWDSRTVASRLREASPPKGYARVEGSAPPLDPSAFRPPSQALKR